MNKYILLAILFFSSSIGSANWSRTGDLNFATRGPEGALLTNGRYIKIGGYNQSTYEIFDPATGTWSSGTLPTTDPMGHTMAMLLPNGKVLYTTEAGTCYLYNAFTNSWVTSSVNIPWGVRGCATLLKDGDVLLQYSSSGACQLYNCWTDALIPTGSTNAPHVGGSEALLPDGKVLLIGGGSVWENNTRKCEIYDPGAGTWSYTGDLITAQNSHVSVLLPSDKVLVAGGYLVNGQCEVYDPGTGIWSSTGSLGHFPRSVATMALLPCGKALIAGGADANRNSIQQCELYDYTAGTWSATDNMAFVRSHFSLVILPTGKELAVGAPYSEWIGDDSVQCEIYDPSEPYWEVKSPLHQERGAHTATPLPIIHTQVCSTNILVAGGENSGGYLSTCELYNYDLDLVANTGALNIARSHHTAVLLPSGKVIAVGGKNSTGLIDCCELYDANTESWSVTGSLNIARFDHTATLLKNGKVLVTGGKKFLGYSSDCEEYVPSSGVWNNTAPMSISRVYHTAVLLLDGRVMVIGGKTSGGVTTNSCEIWDGVFWSPAPALNTARCLHTAVLLQSGKVLVIGGKDSGGNALTSCEIYNPATGSWSAEHTLTYARYMHNSTLIYSGLVLVTGGQDGLNNVSMSEIFDPATHEWKDAGSLNIGRHYGTCTLVPTSKPYVVAIGGQSGGNWINSIERHDVGLGYQADWQSTITNYQRITPISDSMHIEGTLFRGISEADGGNHVHVVSNDHPIISVVRVGGGNWQGNGGGDIIYMPLSSSWDELHTDVRPPANAPQGYYRLWSIVNGIPCKWYKECVEVEETQTSNLKTQISVYPNPSTGTIYIKFASLSPVTAELSIYDCSGRIVRESNISHPSARIQLDGLNSGIYFYTIKSSDSELKGKFVLVR